VSMLALKTQSSELIFDKGKVFCSMLKFKKQIFERTSFLFWALFVAALLVGTFVFDSVTLSALIKENSITGYTLLGFFVMLALFNLRKRFPVIPVIGRAHWWYKAHIILGLLCVFVYFAHSGTFWPSSSYERLIALSFYLVFISGLLGLFFQFRFPAKLTACSRPIVFERIPDAIHELRDAVKDVIEESVTRCETDVLLNFYSESLDHFFRRPRFFMSHLLGSENSSQWLKDSFAEQRRYCRDDEQLLLDKLYEFGVEKNDIDKQYALRLTLKAWLFVHLPAVIVLMVMVIWHVLLINVYSL
jgi:hypothetical protein